MMVSLTLLYAGCAGFFTFTQCLHRQAPIGAVERLRFC
jgi:hypothetical protein